VAWGIILAVCLGSLSWAGNCHHFYQQHHAQQVAVVQPLYFAGQATENEAVMRKAIREELAALLKGQPQPGTSQQTAPVAQAGSVLAAKCGKCHSGDGARGGVRFDLASVADDHFRRSMEIMGLAKVWDGSQWVEMPTAMKPHVAGLTPQDKGAITEEMLYKPAKPEPQVVPDPPAEVPGVLK